MRIFLYCADSKNNFTADYDNEKISKTLLVTTPTVNRECVGNEYRADKSAPTRFFVRD